MFQSLSCFQLFCDPKDSTPLGSSVHGIFPGKNSGAGYPYLLQGIFPTQGKILLTSPAAPELSGFFLLLGEGGRGAEAGVGGQGVLCAGSSQLSQLFSGWGRGWRYSLVAVCGLIAVASRCTARGLGHRGLRSCHSRALEHRLTSCDTRD